MPQMNYYSASNSLLATNWERLNECVPKIVINDIIIFFS